jgi:hypothetical protein
MKVPEYIKEKAIIKLKEIKGKTDDSSIKAKQYLDALLKIPFGVFREEPILKFIKENNIQFIEIMNSINTIDHTGITIPKKSKYSTVEIIKHLSTIEKIFQKLVMDDIHFIIKNQTTKKYSEVIKYIQNNHKESNILTNITIPKSKETRISIVKYLLAI